MSEYPGIFHYKCRQKVENCTYCFFFVICKDNYSPDPKSKDWYDEVINLDNLYNTLIKQEKTLYFRTKSMYPT